MSNFNKEKIRQIQQLQEELGTYLTSIKDDDLFSFCNGFDDHDYTGKELKEDPTLVTWLWCSGEGFKPAAVLVNGTAGLYSKTSEDQRVFTFIPKNKPIKGFLWTGPESMSALEALLVKMFKTTTKKLDSITMSSEAKDCYWISATDESKDILCFDSITIKCGEYVYVDDRSKKCYGLKTMPKSEFEELYIKIR